MATLGRNGLLFRQLFDKTSSTYTYLLADTQTKDAVLIDTVQEQVERDLTLVKELGLKLKYCISTHVHADHVTGNACIKDTINNKEGSTNQDETVKSVISRASGAKGDILVDERDDIKVGNELVLNFLHCPGHTNGCMTIVDYEHKLAFTGDTLLIRGCGRTDFQGGSSKALYESVHAKIFALGDDYLVYPAHDYNGRTCSSVGEERRFNPRLTKSLEEFTDMMAKLDLPKPNMIDVAVPKNLRCGV